MSGRARRPETAAAPRRRVRHAPRRRSRMAEHLPRGRRRKNKHRVRRRRPRARASVWTTRARPTASRRKQRERTWRDLSQNALYDIVRRLDDEGAKTKRRDLSRRARRRASPSPSRRANKLIQVAAPDRGTPRARGVHELSFRIERDALREGDGAARGVGGAGSSARRHVRRDDPRTLSSDKIVRAKINARLVAASLPVLAAFLRDSGARRAPARRSPRATRVPRRLASRSSGPAEGVDREMPALRKTLWRFRDERVRRGVVTAAATLARSTTSERRRRRGRERGEAEKRRKRAARRGGRRSGRRERRQRRGRWVGRRFMRTAPPPPLSSSTRSSPRAPPRARPCASPTRRCGRWRARGGEDEGESSEAARTWAALWGETHARRPAEPGSGRGGGRRRSTRAGTGTPPEAATAGRRRSARIAARPTSRAAAAPESLFRRKRNIPRKHPRKHPRERWALSRAPAPARVATRSTCRTTSAAAAWVSRGDTPRRSARPPRLDPRQRPRATRRKRRTRRTGIRTATRRRASRTWSSAWGRGKANTPQYVNDEDVSDDNRSDGPFRSTALPSALEVQRQQRARLHEHRVAHGLTPMEHDLTPPDVAVRDPNHSRRPFGGFWTRASSVAAGGAVVGQRAEQTFWRLRADNGYTAGERGGRAERGREAADEAGRRTDAEPLVGSRSPRVDSNRGRVDP